MNRASLVSKIQDELGQRQLIWFGTRGEDVEAATDIRQFSGAYSLIGKLKSRPSADSVSLEDLSLVRPDLDTFDIDDHLRSPHVAELRDRVLKALSRPSALLTYRPTLFSSAIGFSRIDRCQSLGLFKGLQNAFEHKPWLESSIAALGIPAISWRYVPDRELLDTRELFRDGSVMLRRSRTTGGVGLVKVDDPGDLERSWPEEDEAFVSVSRYIEDAIPLNVGGVVWGDGVTVHRASLQLIGIPELTSRRFGYCGNDFIRAAELDPSIHDQVDDATRAIGRWLGSTGYMGAFGVDFLLSDGVALFTEVNPRFQGSTHLSCQLSVERQESCLITEHIGAFLGMPAPPCRPLREQMRDRVDLAQLVIHNTGKEGLHVDPSQEIGRLRRLPGFNRADVLADGAALTAPGGTIGRVSVRTAVTRTGFELCDPWSSAVGALHFENSAVAAPGTR